MINIPFFSGKNKNKLPLGNKFKDGHKHINGDLIEATNDIWRNKLDVTKATEITPEDALDSLLMGKWISGEVTDMQEWKEIRKDVYYETGYMIGKVKLEGKALRKVYLNNRLSREYKMVELAKLWILDITNKDCQVLIHEDKIIINPLNTTGNKWPIRIFGFNGNNIELENTTEKKFYGKILLKQNWAILQYERPTNDTYKVITNGNNVLVYDNRGTIRLNKTIVQHDEKDYKLLNTLNLSTNGKIVALEGFEKYEQDKLKTWLNNSIRTWDKDGIAKTQESDFQGIYDIQINDNGIIAYIGKNKEWKIALRLWDQEYKIVDPATPELFYKWFKMKLDNDNKVTLSYPDKDWTRQRCEIKLLQNTYNKKEVDTSLVKAIWDENKF